MNSKKFRGKKQIATLVTLGLAMMQAGYGIYADTSPVITPTADNGKMILFDNAHAQTAGAADWVIDGGFSDFANDLAGEGYSVKELRKGSSITYSDLSDAAVFVIPEANVPFKVSEQEALAQYVADGGSILFIADHYNADRNKNRWDSSEVFNGYRRGAYDDPAKGMNSGERNSAAMQEVVSSDWLSTEFGVRFRYNALGDLSANQIVAPGECFNITSGISSVAMHAGSTVAITNPQVAKGIIYTPEGGISKWSSAVDQGVYNNGGIAEGAYVAIAKKGKGKAAFIGDSSLVEDATPKYLKEETGKKKTTYDGYKEEDDALLLMQLTNWLANQEDYTSFADQGITLDTATALYDFETPENSTEPQSEPWATASGSYKWYDSTTFANGAYKYIDESGDTPISSPDPTPTPVEDAAYVINQPNYVIADQELPLTLEFNNLTPNTTYSNYRIGAYLDGGTQVGLFKKLSKSWPTSYGYSDDFSFTTDDNGHASTILVFKLKPGTLGDINIRIKQGSKKILTEKMTVTADEVDSSKAVGTPVYDMIYASTLKVANETAITVRVTNMQPNQTLSNLRVGAYLDGGTQIGLFMKEDGTYPTAYGYSDYFTLTADENGVAYKTFVYKLKTDGAANLRIKQGTKNVLTDKVTIS
ncbi:DNA-binding protein [Cellulosilyticum ruminicola]|uniref:DNA-binding protein n=1 Tax=Cellulosilyticum ruminicola TaxID=425254 RepID=UPI000A9AF24A|nr:DNA-binding protein [Cellulosilyticum ruminicola]